MTTLEAVTTWKQMQRHVAYEDLQNAERHQLFHDVVSAIMAAKKSGELTAEQISNLGE